MFSPFKLRFTASMLKFVYKTGYGMLLISLRYKLQQLEDLLSINQSDLGVWLSLVSGC